MKIEINTEEKRQELLRALRLLDKYPLPDVADLSDIKRQLKEGKMKMTAHQIWKAIQYTNPQDLLDKYGFESDSIFELVDL